MLRASLGCRLSLWIKEGVLVQVSHVKASYLGLRCSLEDREMMSLLQQWCQFTSAWLIFTATGSTASQVPCRLSPSRCLLETCLLGSV